MKFIRRFIICPAGTLLAIASLAVLSPFASGQNQVSIVARCLSFQVQPVSQTIAGYGTVTTYLTTYTGVDLIPPLHDVSGSFWLLSGEVKPVAGQPGIYGTDYMSISSVYGLIECGHILVTLPTTDSDGNGVPNFLQRENGVDLPFTSTTTAIYPSRTTVNSRGRLVRAANQVTGTFYYTNSANSIVATWNVLHVGGNATYVRSNSVPMGFNLVSTAYDGSTRLLTGTANATVSSNTISIPAFNLTGSDGISMSVATPFALSRSGAVYMGALSMADGLPETSWVDFANYIVEITDPHDSNGNGVPDLTDTPKKPTLTIESAGSYNRILLTGQASHSYTLYGSTDLKTWNPIRRISTTTPTHEILQTPTTSRRFYRLSFP